METTAFLFLYSWLWDNEKGTMEYSHTVASKVTAEILKVSLTKEGTRSNSKCPPQPESAEARHRFIQRRWEAMSVTEQENKHD